VFSALIFLDLVEMAPDETEHFPRAPLARASSD